MILRQSALYAAVFIVTAGASLVEQIVGPTSGFINYLGLAAAEEKLFDVDINKQKANLQKDMTQTEEFLSQNKLSNARSQIELLNHKLKQMKSGIGKDEAATFQQKIDGYSQRISAKEDSLAKVNIDVLHNQGVEPALAYLQNELKMMGVSEKRANAVEKQILDEAPQVQQSLERKQIERAVKALQNNEPLDQNIDPYIMRTAQRIIKAHADSISAVENAKNRKEMEEKQKVERARLEKEEKERKVAEEKAEKQRQEDEKIRLAEQEKQRKQAEAEEKEKQRLAKIEEERQKQQMAVAEKARKDSVAAFRKQEELAQQDKQRLQKLTQAQKEQEKQARKEEERRDLELAQKEKARQDSIATAQKLAEQMQQKDRQKQEQLARQNNDRQKQILVQMEQMRKDSLAAIAAQEKQNKAIAEKPAQRESAPAVAEQQKPGVLSKNNDRQKQIIAQREQMRKDSIVAFAEQEKQGKAALEEQRRAALEEQRQQQKRKESAPVAAEKQPEPPRPQVVIASTPHPEAGQAEKPPVLSKNAQAYLQSLNDNRKKAQEQLMELYDLMDKNQSHEALEKFKQNRKFIAQFVDAQVFNVLEQSVVQSAIAEQSQASAPAEPQAQPARAKPRLPEQESIDIINSYIRDNKIEAAYGEFKKTEKMLKKFMTSEDFKQLKNMVESSYKIRKQAKN